MNANINFDLIKTEAPTAWKDFEGFYSQNFNKLQFLNGISFEILPFEMQLGILLKYFTENAVEVDICNNDFDALPETFFDTFRTYEKVIAHYS
ncbi:MAG: hypothetical protein J7604_10100 [Sporocytophaga sp.]|uniref:hypothetical protein n=1 Tax=Sporocytophaga sp. TaxID=2231183 RepID=UPI001B1BE353|nr:hypothetical protein [Sporocytophaga sp.]MBO9700549.1 hypothetical protein [Sporocytophaga sp.]